MAREDFEEFAYRSVIRMIIDNQFKPGDFLLETELAEKLQISRTPVRQALSRLIAEGFLDKKKKKGCVIPVPEAEDARQVFLAREIIEGQTAAAAARSAEESEIKELRLLIKKQETAFQEDKKETYSLIKEHIRHTYELLFGPWK